MCIARTSLTEPSPQARNDFFFFSLSSGHEKRMYFRAGDALGECMLILLAEATTAQSKAECP